MQQNLYRKSTDINTKSSFRRKNSVPLNKLLGTYAAESAQFAKRLLETPLGGRIGTSVINILISGGHIPGIDALTKEIPIAGPILSILTDSVRKKTSSLVAKATDRIMNDALSDYTPSLEGRIEQGAESVAKAALQGQFPDTSDVATNLSSAAQANLAKFEAAQKEFDQLLETKQQALFKANRDLVQRLRIGRAKKGLPEWSTNKPRADDIFSSFNLTARPRISSIAEIEKMKQQIKIEEAIDKLISAALKITDPLAQNHILTGIENAVSDPLVSSQVQKLTDLGALAGISSREVTAALHELKALEPHPSSMDYVHTTRIKPIRVEPIRIRLPRR
jgi:hypothetical protein